MQTTITAPARPVPVAGARPVSAGRLVFVDNIRVLLTILVLLHHLMITYAGSGDWYYEEGREDFATVVVGSWFCATDQAFFMGLFLLVAAYFVPGSFDRKGALRFIKDRLIRLGIPLVIYSWVVNPVFVYALFVARPGTSFWDWYPARYFSTGPLLGQGPTWFIETLLLFSLVYAAWRVLAPQRSVQPAPTAGFPSRTAIALFALALGVVTFLIRIVFVMDEYKFEPLNLQLAFFTQYIVLFVVGLVAYRRNWLVTLPDTTGRFWLRAAVLFVLAWAPLMILGGAPDDPRSFAGGLHWQSFANSLWESLTCVSISIGLIYAFRRYLNGQGPVAALLSRNAYTAYLIHPLVIVPVALAMQGVMLYPLLKWLLAVVISLPLCFLLSSLIRKLPYAGHVL